MSEPRRVRDVPPLRPGPSRRRAAGVAQLLVQLARRVLERRDGEDLHAAQWSALRYFARAGRRSANVAGLSSYLGNTTGSASRTVRSLVERGLVEGAPLREDARSHVFTLTARGEEALERDPLGDVTDVLARLDGEALDALADALERVRQGLEAGRT